MSALVKGVEMPKGGYEDIRMYDDGTWVGLPLDHVKPMTNADRIRSMTDDELAAFLLNVWEDGEQVNQQFAFNKSDWMDWLQQEVRE